MRGGSGLGRFNPGDAHQEGISSYYSSRELIIPEDLFSTDAYGSRKDGTGPAEGQPPERRDGFRFLGLVMSIIFSHIVSEKKDSGSGRVPGGRKRLPAERSREGWPGNMKTCSTTG